MRQITDFFEKNPIFGQILQLLLSLVLAVLISTLLLRLSRKLFRKLRELPSGKKLNTVFLENIFRFIIIFIAVLWVIMSSDLTRSFGQTLFAGTAVIAAIVGFAAQSVLSDVMCGAIISTTKPFELGDRIELDNGISGIVKEMTLRHVVLQGIDSQMFVVPNSRMNSFVIKNLSYRSEIRSIDFHFKASYDSDPEQVCALIQDAVRGCPDTVPGKKDASGKTDYAPIYFMNYESSALDFRTTVYYMPTTPTEVVKSQVNTAVKKAFAAAGIEIPYNYLNIVTRQAGSVSGPDGELIKH